jgi:hypothetical protein
MEGVQSFDAIYAFYRDDEVTDFCRATMLPFLDLVADILKAKRLFYGTSHAQLNISRYGTWAALNQHPSILVSADHPFILLTYHEVWPDGTYFRSRLDGIKCPVEYGRAALIEMLARLRA